MTQVEKFDFFFIDGTPKESLAYLKAAEPLLAPGAVVVCDNVQARRQRAFPMRMQSRRDSG